MVLAGWWQQTKQPKSQQRRPRSCLLSVEGSRTSTRRLGTAAATKYGPPRLVRRRVTSRVAPPRSLQPVILAPDSLVAPQHSFAELPITHRARACSPTTPNRTCERDQANLWPWMAAVRLPRCLQAVLHVRMAVPAITSYRVSQVADQACRCNLCQAPDHGAKH